MILDGLWAQIQPQGKPLAGLAVGEAVPDFDFPGAQIDGLAAHGSLSRKNPTS